jgi:hypothetical protein
LTSGGRISLNSDRNKTVPVILAVLASLAAGLLVFAVYVLVTA